MRKFLTGLTAAALLFSFSTVSFANKAPELKPRPGAHLQHDKKGHPVKAKKNKHKKPKQKHFKHKQVKPYDKKPGVVHKPSRPHK